MMVWMGWLILLPFAGAWWLTRKLVDACIRRGGAMRLLGATVSLLVGGGSAVVGYVIGPVVGWLIMAVGAFVAVAGTGRCVIESKPTRSQLEREFLMGLVGKGELAKSDRIKWDDMLASAKEEAKKMLGSDQIEDYDRLGVVCLTLASRATDAESSELFEALERLKSKSTIREARLISEQGSLDMRNRMERERFERVWLDLYNRKGHDPEADELWSRLYELKRAVDTERKRH